MRYQLYRTKKADGSTHPKWRIKYFDDAGRYMFQETGAVDKRLTETRAKNKIQELERDRHNTAMGLSSAPGTKITEVLASYLKIKTSKGGRKSRKWAAGSKEKATFILGRWVNEMGWETIGDVKLQGVENRLADRKASGAADNSIAAEIRHVKALTRWALDRELLLADPLRQLKVGHIEKSNPYRDLKPAELVTLLSGVDGEKYLIYKGGAVTGLRVRELCGLKVEWFDWARGPRLPAELVGNKAKKDILVEFPADYLAEVREWCRSKAPSDFVFNPIFANNAARSLQMDCDLLDIPVKTKDGKVVFHSLRHSFISIINELNPDIKTRLDVSRHGDLKTNLGYSHEEMENRRRLIEAVSAKLHGHKGVILENLKIETLENKGPDANEPGTCTSASSNEPPVSRSESFEPLEKRQLHLKGRPRVSQPGRKVASHCSHMARQLEDIWVLLEESGQQSIVNHARALLLGLKVHRKAVG